MKIFKDKELKKPLEQIHFGIVEAGSSKTITVFLFNDTSALLTDLEFQVRTNLPETVEIIDSPSTMEPKSVKPLKLKWSPKAKVKKALKGEIIIRGVEVYFSTQQVVTEE
jgi:hypothetical protein